MIDLIILNTVIFAAFFLKGVAGFGNTLILNGGLALIRENRFITPIDTLLGLPVNIFMLFRERRYIRFSIALPLLISVAAGIIPGILLLDSVNDRILKSILGVVLLIISIDFFLGRKKVGKGESSTKSVNKALIISTGFISGILMGLFGIGVLIPAMLNRMGLDKRNFRGSLCFVFTAESIIRVTGYTMRGIINIDIFYSFLFFIPAAFAGVILSRIVDRKINDNMIRKIVIIVLIISSVLLIIKNRFGLNGF